MLLPDDVDDARSAGLHLGSLRSAVLLLKFRRKLALVDPMAGLAAAELERAAAIWRPDALVPVPIHWSRRLERGFNQSRLLARRLARAWGCPVRDDVLVRAVATPSQTSLDGAARRANVRRAFRLRHPELVAGRHVVVVDDILTTGATLSECARCLEDAAPRTVGVLAVARVV